MLCGWAMRCVQTSCEVVVERCKGGSRVWCGRSMCGRVLCGWAMRCGQMSCEVVVERCKGDFVVGDREWV